MKSKVYDVRFRRKSEGKTDYKKRLTLLQGDMPRLVIRNSLKNICLQIIKYEATSDKVLIAASSKELEKFGWSKSKLNIPAAYLTGFLLGHKSKKLKITKIIVDFGLTAFFKGGRLSAALKGCIDGGLNVICDQKIFPTEDRIKGKHIENMTPIFEDTKKKIEGEK